MKNVEYSNLDKEKLQKIQESIDNYFLEQEKKTFRYNYPTQEEVEKIFECIDGSIAHKEDLRDTFSHFINKLERVKNMKLVNNGLLFSKKDNEELQNNIAEFRTAIINSDLGEKKERIIEHFDKYIDLNQRLKKMSEEAIKSDIFSFKKEFSPEVEKPKNESFKISNKDIIERIRRENDNPRFPEKHETRLRKKI